MRLFAHLSCLFFLSGAAFGQSEEPAKFEIADVHPSPPGSHLYSSGPYLHGTRYEIRTASIVDLIQMAYSTTDDKILGGPSWLDLDRFDILAQVPPDAKADELKIMLRDLLADRFQLKSHDDTRSFPSFTLTAGEKPKLKESDGSVPPGCQSRSQASQPDGPGTRATQVSVTATCHSTAMATFVNMLRGLMMTNNDSRPPEVVDATGLKGIWDFDFKYSMSLNSGPNVGEDLFNAVDKQLGLS